MFPVKYSLKYIFTARFKAVGPLKKILGCSNKYFQEILRLRFPWKNITKKTLIEGHLKKIHKNPK